MCYAQNGHDEWREHFCLVNPMRRFDVEDEATAQAEADLNEAAAAKAANGSDAAFALALKNKGYVSVEGFRRATE
jgi:hypothetical protein